MMASNNRNVENKKIDFLKRHMKGLYRHFNANSALTRAENILEEIQTLRANFDNHLSQESVRYLIFPKYYIAGLVTCLEWHARSRLHDILHYNPKCFEAKDIEQAAVGKNLDLLFEHQLTVAQFVAASTLVSDFDKYINIFNRVLKCVGSIDDAAEIAKSTPDSGQIFSYFNDLFELRHALIHEIDETQVGHWNIRDIYDLQDAESACERVIALIRRLEQAISANAPGDFPNVIAFDDYTSRSDRLKEMINELEEVLMSKMNAEVDENINNCSSVIESFKNIINLSRSYLESEENVLRSFSYPGYQYHSLAEPLVEMLYEQRLNYLKVLEEELKSASVIGSLESSSFQEPDPEP